MKVDGGIQQSAQQGKHGVNRHHEAAIFDEHFAAQINYLLVDCAFIFSLREPDSVLFRLVRQSFPFAAGWKRPKVKAGP